MLGDTGWPSIFSSLTKPHPLCCERAKRVFYSQDQSQLDGAGPRAVFLKEYHRPCLPAIWDKGDSEDSCLSLQQGKEDVELWGVFLRAAGATLMCPVSL